MAIGDFLVIGDIIGVRQVGDDHSVYAGLYATGAEFLETVLHDGVQVAHQDDRDLDVYKRQILIRTELKKGALFLSEGEVCTQLGYVYKGMVRQFYFKNKKELTEHFASEDNIFICIESFLDVYKRQLCKVTL